MIGSDASLQFRLFGIPIQVSFFFLLLALLLSRSWTGGQPVMMAAFVVITFVSVLAHELGHAFMARAFGQRPVIMLYGMGGVTSWRPRGHVGEGKRLLVALAGPAVGIALAILVAVVGRFTTEPDTLARSIVRLTFAVNIAWGLFNLLPMLPLDGGNVMASVFDMVVPGKGRRAARYVSILVALGVGALLMAGGAVVGGLLCGLFVWINIQDLRSQAPPPPPPSEQVIDVKAAEAAMEPPGREPTDRP